MRRNQVGKCPKCGGDMMPGKATNYFRILKPGDLQGDLAQAFYCQDCGFVELYKEPSTKEPRRLIKPVSELDRSRQPVSGEEQQKPEEKETRRESDKRLIR